MTLNRLRGGVVAVAMLLLPAAALAQFTTPNVTTAAGDVSAVLGPTTFVSHGLVGVGRFSASTLDNFAPIAETFGSVSGLQITDWTRNANGSYSGTFDILPDRGYNSGNFFSNYAARIYTLGFNFTPYTGTTNIGGSTFGEKIAAQNQIIFTTGISGVKFTYFDPISNATTLTTGLDPADGFITLFGQIVPYVKSYTGLQSPSSVSNSVFPNVNKLALDCEGLALKGDGTGYISDEYGGHLYYFNAQKQIIGVIVPPQALEPHFPAAGVPYFGSLNTPLNGRRNNQGLEGVALSPDGTRLFALLQSATIQDSDGNAQNRRQTRLLVYDVSTNPTPTTPVAEYALTLPTYRTNGNGQAVNATAAQSEIVALDTTRLLVLSRDGNGLGNSATNPSVIKSVLLVDLTVGSPSNFANDASKNAEGGLTTSSPGVLAAGITPLSSVEAVNLLNSVQFAKFNVALDSGTGQVSQLTLGEKWEGMALVPARDPARPNDYFLFVGNDNDFLTASGFMLGPDNTIVGYDGFSGYPASRQPANAGPGNVNANDTIFLVYRVTITAGLGVEARASGNPLPVPIHFVQANSGGTLPTPFAVQPSSHALVTLDAPQTTTANGRVYRFVGWQSAGGAPVSTPSITFVMGAPTTLTALYELVPPVTLTFRAANLATGAAIPVTFSVSQPAQGATATPFDLARQPFEPFTVTAPYVAGACTFWNWSNPEAGTVLAAITLNGNVATSQTWVARYRCP